MKPATMYPNTNGCLSRLKMIVVIPAHVRINAKSIINGDNSDILYSTFCDEFCDFYNHVHSFFNRLDRNKFIATMKVQPAGKDIRARKSLE